MADRASSPREGSQIGAKSSEMILPPAYADDGEADFLIAVMDLDGRVVA